MASCAQIEGLAQAYIDGELSPSERLHFEQHIGACRVCATSLERQRAVSHFVLDAYSEHRLQRSLVTDVMAHLPEMDDVRLVRQMNQRAKEQRSRFRNFFTILTPVATMVVVFLAAAIVYSWPAPDRVDAKNVGMVTYSQGDVNSLASGASAFAPSTLRDLINREAVFETGETGMMAASIAGPNLVKMGENTRVKVYDDRRVALQSGKIWVHVSKALRGARVFRVDAPDGTITVFGTTFGVEVGEGKTIVTLLEGEVTVENDTTFAVMRPNQQVYLVRGQNVLSPFDVNAAETLRWADSIQPDAVAQAEFLTKVRTLDETILRAENVWLVDTGTHSVRSITFGWRPHSIHEELASYVVYVTDRNGTPVFIGRLDGEDLAQRGRTQLELPMPVDAMRANTTAFIRLVPDTQTGSVETDFDYVAFVGVTP